jgi:hypothetical protein
MASAVVGAYIGGNLITGNDPSMAGLAERAVVLSGLLWLSAIAITEADVNARSVASPLQVDA